MFGESMQDLCVIEHVPCGVSSAPRSQGGATASPTPPRRPSTPAPGFPSSPKPSPLLPRPPILFPSSSCPTRLFLHLNSNAPQSSAPAPSALISPYLVISVHCLSLVLACLQSVTWMPNTAVRNHLICYPFGGPCTLALSPANSARSSWPRARAPNEH